MKKRISSILLCLCLIGTIFAVVPSTASALNRGHNEKTIRVGQSITLSSFGSYPFRWSVDDASIVKIEPSGNIKDANYGSTCDVVGLRPGVATVTLRSKELVWEANASANWFGSYGESVSYDRTTTCQITVVDDTGSSGDNSSSTTRRYTVTFDANGGSTPVKSWKYQEGAMYGSFPTPTRSGYTFWCWTEDREGKNWVAEDARSKKDLTLYAQWVKNPSNSAKRCMVTFDANGGSTPVKSREYLEGTMYGSFPIPTRSGYTFCYWSKDSNGRVQPSTKALVKEDHTLYAIWMEGTSSDSTSSDSDTYTVTFDANGGSTPVKSWKYSKEAIYASFPTPTRPGYTFRYWSKDRDGRVEVTEDTQSLEDCTLYAQWKAESASTNTNQSGNITVPSSPTTAVNNPGKGSVMLDTANYIMAPGNIYDIGVTIKDPSGRTLSGAEVQALYQSGKMKVSDSRSGSIANLTQLPNGNFRVNGKNEGTCYIVYEIAGTHASVKIDVKKGEKQHGTAVRHTSYFTQNVF